MRLRRAFLWSVTFLVVWQVKFSDCKNDECLVDSTRNKTKRCGYHVMDSKLDILYDSGIQNLHEQTAAHEHTAMQELLPKLSVYNRSIKSIKNTLCRQDAEKIMLRIRELDIDALKMLDSTGKMSSGVLNGNVNQLGDFDQCLSVNSKSDIQGKYCLAFLDVRIKHHEMDQLIHAYGPIVSNLSDPGHRVARFSTVSWGFCMPTTCSSQDLENWITDMWADSTGVSIKVKVESDMCVSNAPEPYSLAKIMTIVFFLTLATMTVVGSFLKEDDSKNKEHEHIKEDIFVQLLKAFSLRRNMTTLLKTTTPEDDVNCLHGIRALSALALIIFHKSAAVMFNPYVNRTAMAKSLGLAWSVIGRTAMIYTDSFILISGLLTSYIFIKDLDKKKKIDVKDKYWTRFFRIAPNLIATILFCTYIMVDMGSGPQWNLVVKHHSDLCKSNMWKNLLFIHNYFGFENMCLTHTHQLGIDMQLFVASPLIVWIVWRHLKTGLLLVSALGVASTVLRYTVAIDKQLSPVLYFGASVTQMFDTANFSYILPSHRATVYLMGITMGLFLRRFKTVPLNKISAFFLYVVGLSAGLYAMCGPYPMARKGYVYSSIDAANWNAMAPILWSTMLCICVVLCSNGYGGFLNDILTWRGFVVFTRIAYGVYLVQFPVFFYNVGSQRTPEFYTPLMLTNLGEICVVMMSAVVLTLLVDLPFQQIKKISWRKAQVQAVKTAPKEPLETLTSIPEREETILKRRQRHIDARITG